MSPVLFPNGYHTSYPGGSHLGPRKGGKGGKSLDGDLVVELMEIANWGASGQTRQDGKRVDAAGYTCVRLPDGCNVEQDASSLQTLHVAGFEAR